MIDTGQISSAIRLHLTILQRAKNCLASVIFRIRHDFSGKGNTKVSRYCSRETRCSLWIYLFNWISRLATYDRLLCSTHDLNYFLFRNGTGIVSTVVQAKYFSTSSYLWSYRIGKHPLLQTRSISIGVMKDFTTGLSFVSIPESHCNRLAPKWPKPFNGKLVNSNGNVSSE